jgi:LemA protein
LAEAGEAAGEGEAEGPDKMSSLESAAGALSLFALSVAALFVALAYNRLVTLQNRCDNQWSQIDIQLKRRNDLIPKLVEFVGEYARYERLVLENVTNARSLVMDAASLSKKAAASDVISKNLGKLLLVSENYPNLMADESFLNLQAELRDTEGKIAYSRQFYNEVVLKYETMRQTFPTNLIAGFFRFQKREYFTAAG